MPTQFVSPGITRFEIGKRLGFMVRICRNGQRINEYFSDSVFGGKLKAKKAAQARYEQLVKKLGPIAKPTENKLTSRNTTGAVGVHKARSLSTRWPNCESWGYCASWVNEDGSRGKINFAWKKYGKKNAFQLAVLARKMKSIDRETVMAKFERSLGKKTPNKQVSSHNKKKP